MKNEPKRIFSAIMFSDIVGYTALMGKNEDLAYQLVKRNVRLHQEIIKKYHGKLVKEMGDGVLSSYPSAKEAVGASLELQQYYQRTKEYSLRIGIHFGEILEDRHDVFGDAVNIASRLQTLGSPGSVLFSNKIHEDLPPDCGLESMSLGKFKLKNVKDDMEIFALANDGLVIPKRGEMLKLLESRLKKAMLAGLIFLTLALAAFGIYHKSFIKRFSPDKEKSIAVLPFKNISVDDDRYFLVSGLTFDIISQLSKISDLRVISKSSSDFFLNSNESHLSIAKDLGVNYLLESSIQEKENQIRVRTDLIDGFTGRIIWGESFEMNALDIFKLQNEIPIKIATSLSAKLTESEKNQIKKIPTGNVGAYEYYLRGRDLYFNYRIVENQKAILEFKKAISIDKDFALAWAGLSDAYSLKYYFSKSDNKIWFDSAMISGNKAIALDSNSSEGYKSLSTIYNYDGQYGKSLEYLKKALEINPNNAQAVGNFATVNFSLGNFPEALVWHKKAAGFYPNNYIPLQLIGWNYRLQLDFENAILWLKKSLSKAPSRESYEQLALAYLAINQKDSAYAQFPRLLALVDTVNYDTYEEKKLLKEDASKIFESIGIIYFYGEDLDKARIHFETSFRLHPGITKDPWAYSPVYLGYLWTIKNKKSDAETILAAAKHLNLGEIANNSQDSENYFITAAIFAIQGEEKDCIKYLKMAREKKWFDVYKITHGQIFLKMRNNPDFKKIVAEMNYEISLMRSAKTN